MILCSLSMTVGHTVPGWWSFVSSSYTTYTTIYFSSKADAKFHIYIEYEFEEKKLFYIFLQEGTSFIVFCFHTARLYMYAISITCGETCHAIFVQKVVLTNFLFLAPAFLHPWELPSFTTSRSLAYCFVAYSTFIFLPFDDWFKVSLSLWCGFVKIDGSNQMVHDDFSPIFRLCIGIRDGLAIVLKVFETLRFESIFDSRKKTLYKMKELKKRRKKCIYCNSENKLMVIKMFHILNLNPSLQCPIVFAPKKGPLETKLKFLECIKTQQSSLSFGKGTSM